ncbi:DUF6542 domain-containing protein [Saccharothrix longispora]|uniref:DUF6542 domain-containing protein n=1 Tax=Saccharothrix longispora TaxID=33920 RepID=A0ABU1Q6K5_9PSEU|nr:DUF6542 domain-containing protein [Saccharothrix longispora]MDR6598153.1 hypothetical protein [Saccharothrix longispora]
MTAATRDDSRSDPEDDEFEDVVRWNDRAMFGSFRGLPWWAAVAIAFVVAVVGAWVDLGSSAATVGWAFGVAFFVGCVGAVVFVERRSMFGPVVQPPLVLAIVVPTLVVFTSGVPSGGLTSLGLNLGKPLIDGFPAMALTTAVTVLLGVVRVSTQKDPNRLTKDEKREARRKPVGEKPPREKPVRDKPVREKPVRESPAREKATREKATREKPAPEDRPKRPRPAADDTPPRRRPPAPAADEDRPKRPRPRDGAAPADRPRRPASREGRPPQRKPRPRDED